MTLIVLHFEENKVGFVIIISLNKIMPFLKIIQIEGGGIKNHILS